MCSANPFSLLSAPPEIKLATSAGILPKQADPARVVDSILPKREAISTPQTSNALATDTRGQTAQQRYAATTLGAK